MFIHLGTCHGSDGLFLIKPTHTDKSELTPDFKQAVLKHVKAWAKFAASGQVQD